MLGAGLWKVPEKKPISRYVPAFLGKGYFWNSKELGEQCLVVGATVLSAEQEWVERDLSR